MQPKLIQTELARYTPAIWPGKNTSGYLPIGDMVIVLTDQVASQTSGGVKLPDDVLERLNMAAETGVIAAVGEGAFTWSHDRKRHFVGRKPKPGDMVFIERYSGQLLSGQDGMKYRLLADKQVGAIRE
jgi:chaperonin GroES